MTDLAGLTNAMTDVIISVTDKELEKLELKKGFYNRKINISYEDFLEVISGKETRSIPGGSPANVLRGAAALGLETVLFGTVGDDDYGAMYIEDLAESNIQPLFYTADEPSGVCYVLVAPDGEKSHVADLGAATVYGFDFTELKKARYFHTSGYELATDPDTVKETLEHARKIGAKISFDLADPSMIKKERKSFLEELAGINILFATQEEAQELTSLDPLKAIEELSKICPTAVLKKGKKGSAVRQGKEQYEIPIYPVEVVNTNGAGDAYAAGFLFGCARGLNPEECGHFGSYIASRVVGSKKARFS